MLRLVSLFLAFCFSLPATHFPTVSPEKAKQIMEAFEPVIRKTRDDFQIPGLAVGVVVDGQIIYAKGFGFRDLENQEPVNADTAFGIGSCSKAFTAFTLGSLVEEGTISWDQKIIDALPQFRLFDEHATHYLTFRDLISHRSGMARHPYMWYNSKYSRKELLDRLRYLEMAWDVRERFNYGDLSYLIASMAAESVTGKVWEDLVSERILRPLNMKNTTFSLEEMKKKGNFSLPYIERNGYLKQMPFRDFSNIGPAASINSSVNDLLAWMKMLLASGTYGSESLLSAGGIQELFGAQVIASSYAENKDALLSAYGLGWFVHPYRGNYSVSHDGGVDGFTSVVSLFPDRGVGIVVLSNKNLFTAPRYLSLELSDALLELEPRDWLKMSQETIDNAKKTIPTEANETLKKIGTVPSHPIEEYVGEYEHPAYGTITVQLVGDHLEATLHGITSRLGHWHYDVFQLEEDLQDLLIVRKGFKFTFHTGSNGDIERVCVPFELKTGEISFKKKRKSSQLEISYFTPYVGAYEIYGVTIDIVLRNGVLTALIPGQSNYELEPLLNHEFNVKNDNYLVRFILGEEGFAKEVLLVMPFGAYSAQRLK